MPNTYLTQTISSSTGKIFTLSMWIKKSANDSFNQLFHLSSDSNTHKYIDVATKSAYGLDVQLKNGSGGAFVRRRTNRLLRDFSGWFHILIRFDSTQGSAGDRLRIYINGEQETSIDADSTPDVPQDYVTDLNSNGGTLQIGRNPYNGGTGFFDGIISHYYLCDGYSYAPTVFGSTDSTTGEWKINTSPSITMGTNGFTILKDGNTITDQSSNSNDFSLGGGTLTKTEDCPSNVFATLNPLSSNTSTTLSKGSTQVDYGAAAQSSRGTLGFSSGKFYWEIKTSAVGSGYPMVGIGDMDKIEMQVPNQQSYPGGFANSYGIIGDGRVYANGSNTGNQGFTYTTNDIIGIAVDLDSGTKTIKWFKNGSQIATYNITNTATFSVIDYSNASSDQLQYNFGNGYFGTTAVSSAGTNASGNGIFEYDVPTGYTALSTKGLNT